MPAPRDALYFGGMVSQCLVRAPAKGPNQPAYAAKQPPRTLKRKHVLTPLIMQELLPRYREVTEAYMAALLALAFRLLRALALALDLPPEHFRPFFDPPSPFLRPLHYAARASDPEQVPGLGLPAVLKTWHCCN